MFPAESSDTPVGATISALVAAPPSPVYPEVPFPATVDILPVVAGHACGSRKHAALGPCGCGIGLSSASRARRGERDRRRGGRCRSGVAEIDRGPVRGEDAVRTGCRTD